MKLTLWVYKTDEETKSEPIAYVEYNCTVPSGEMAPYEEIYRVLVKTEDV